MKVDFQYKPTSQRNTHVINGYKYINFLTVQVYAELVYSHNIIPQVRRRENGSVCVCVIEGASDIEQHFGWLETI